MTLQTFHLPTKTHVKPAVPCSHQSPNVTSDGRRPMSARARDGWRMTSSGVGVNRAQRLHAVSAADHSHFLSRTNRESTVHMGKITTFARRARDAIFYLNRCVWWSAAPFTFHVVRMPTCNSRLTPSSTYLQIYQRSSEFV